MLENICENIDICRTNEGCLIDLLFKPKCDSIFWLPFQVKTTVRKSHGIYSFKIHKNIYKNMLILLIAIEDKKIWLVDNEIVNGKSNLSIGSGKKSIYTKYEVSVNELEFKIIECYKDFEKYLITKDEANIPISKDCKKEYIYQLLRIDKLPFINFIRPHRNQMVYDFTINNYKVQEKIASITKNSYYIILSKSFGKTNKCYDKEDNDFYWIHFPDNKHFLIIPENILIEKEIIGNYQRTPKSISFLKTFPRSHWLFPYLHSYETLDEVKIKNIFKITF
jgi:hypothetical protein